jgi:protein-histidine pros-kinase
MGAHLNLLGWRKCGEEFPVEIRLSPLQTDSGKLVISAIRDVTERNLVEQSLERAMRLKSHFLANMSHELRTPLNGIIGFSELLVDGKVGPLAAQQATFLGDILSSGRHLLHLVNDLLDLSKIEAGRADLHAESFSVQACIDQVCSALSASSAEKRLCVTTEVSPALDVVYLDRGKLGQILMNLASNAVKFTEPGGEVHICATCGASAELQLQVSDTGVGMGPKELDRLFVEYHRMESDATCRLQGSGLGLTLTRRLVGLLNGSIGVRSEPGRGTTFTVILPYCAPPT